MPEAAPLYGWAVMSGVFTFGGVFTSIAFSSMAFALAVLAIPAGIMVYRRDGAIFAPGTSKIILLSLPLLILVSAMVGSQWGEFSDWLISPRLLLEMDLLPTKQNAHRGGSLIAYPYGWHDITYTASRVSGRLLENAGITRSPGHGAS